MKNKLWLGLKRHLLPVPQHVWQGQVEHGAKHNQERLAFMTADHHRVRDYTVRELPRIAAPIPPERIAEDLALPLPHVVHLLDDLEKHLTFLFRNPQGEVTWAYPVTVDPTPHRITFSTGEQIYAAWAIDTVAVPFVQGHLRKEHLKFDIQTVCTHCGEPIHLEMGSDLSYRVITEEAEPMIFAPMVDFETLKDPSIIDAFWRNSVFFWSEEHVKEHRKGSGEIRGTYLTLAQAVSITPASQGSLFAFPRWIHTAYSKKLTRAALIKLANPAKFVI